MNLYTCICGIGFGSCYPRRDTIIELDITANTERGAKIKARKKYAEIIGEGYVKNCGFICNVKEAGSMEN